MNARFAEPGQPRPSGLPMWVVYDHPSDHPGGLIARYWIGERATTHTLTAETLAQLRERIAAEEDRGIVCLTRHRDDDPCIVEVWL